MSNDANTQRQWPLWRKIIFRFFFILIFLQIAPVYWLNISATDFIVAWYDALIDPLVTFGNRHFFHIRDQLVPLNGSGDTSFAWAQQLTFLSLALLGCLLWSVLDMRRNSYEQLDYWLRTFLRYYLVLVSFSYGTSKLFLLQMPYPSQSLMATPLGDLLPMRLSWVFLGYSPIYQAFAGVLEILVGLLLIFRRTSTAGLLLGAGVFGNVMMLNLGYDIPVKLYSMHYFFYCLFLLAYEWRRLWAFFTNRPAPPYLSYRPHLSHKWMRVSKVIISAVFIFFIVVVPFINGYSEFNNHSAVAGPFNGIYDVTTFVVNEDTIAAGGQDGQRWNDIIFDNKSSGSIGTTDTAFRQRYRRGYFNCEVDTVLHQIIMTRYNDDFDELPVCTMHYKEMKDHIVFTTQLHGGDIYIEARKSLRKYQLAENHFHWLSEYNR